MTVTLPTQLLLPGIDRADVDQLLAELHEASVELAVVGERLQFRPKSAITVGLLERLKLHKPDIIARMQTGRNVPLPCGAVRPIPGQPSVSSCVTDDSAINRGRPHPAVAARVCDPTAHHGWAADSTRRSDSSDSSDSSTAGVTRVSADADRLRAEADAHPKAHSNRGWGESSESPESPELSRLIEWFQCYRDRLPQEPFLLRPGCHVARPHRFYQALDRDIAAGPAGARARYGLSNDLTDLRNLLEGLPEQMTSSQVSRLAHSCSGSGPARTT